MNKFIAISLLVSLSAFAGAPKKVPQKTQKHFFVRSYGLAGCGLGSIVMGKEKDGQIFAGTTNGTSFNQAFGITFGTLNCVPDETHAKADQVDHFIAGNRIALTDDIARGEGESLTVVSGMMKCKDTKNLGSALQTHFREIFESTELTPNEITDRIITVVGQDEELAKTCSVQI